MKNSFSSSFTHTHTRAKIKPRNYINLFHNTFITDAIVQLLMLLLGWDEREEKNNLIRWWHVWSFGLRGSVIWDRLLYSSSCDATFLLSPQHNFRKIGERKKNFNCRRLGRRSFEIFVSFMFIAFFCFNSFCG